MYQTSNSNIIELEVWQGASRESNQLNKYYFQLKAVKKHSSKIQIKAIIFYHFYYLQKFLQLSQEVLALPPYSTDIVHFGYQLFQSL